MGGICWENEQSKLGVFISGKNTYEMWGIFKSILNKFTKQFIPMENVRNNTEIKPKWMNGEIKRLIRETKIAIPDLK